MTGGTGFLGSALVKRLSADGHSVTTLARNPRRPDQVAWDPDQPFTTWAGVLENADAVINLAGAPINKRWTTAHKRALWESRVNTTRALVAAMKSVRHVPPLLISGSAVGIYGSRGSERLTEKSDLGSGFLAELGEAWENEATAAAPQTRVVLLRTGVVLGPGGGALPQMALPYRLFVGGPVGSGEQYISWIHLDDWIAMVRWALQGTVTGPLNVTAPNPVTNAEFSRTLGRALHRPALLHAPGFAVRLALGEMADVVLTSQRVFPEKARSLGFDFMHPALASALRAVYNS